MAILRFSKWRPSAMLYSRNLHFSSCSPCRPAVLPSDAKFRWNRTIGRWFMAKKNRFSRWRPPPSWILKVSIFGHVTVAWFNIWCSVPILWKSDNFSLRYGDLTFFLNGGRPISWILHICIFCPVALVSMPFCFLIQNFAEIGLSVNE